MVMIMVVKPAMEMKTPQAPIARASIRPLQKVSEVQIRGGDLETEGHCRKLLVLSNQSQHRINLARDNNFTKDCVPPQRTVHQYTFCTAKTQLFCLPMACRFLCQQTCPFQGQLFLPTYVYASILYFSLPFYNKSILLDIRQTNRYRDIFQVHVSFCDLPH